MKRPDVVLRNKIANPMRDDVAREKMRQSLLGRKQSEDTKLKRALRLREYYATHPEAKAKLAKTVWEKYTSKIAGTSWLKISRTIRERDGYTCQSCGESTRARLLVHHLDWRGKQRGATAKQMNNDPSNLITLCHKCHNSIHRHKSLDYRERREIMQARKELRV